MLLQPREVPELPVELGDAILVAAARHAALRDRAWLCDLALTSRYVRDLVQPILYETVTITDSNSAQILTTIPSGRFQCTRNLHLRLPELTPDSAACLAPAFSRVHHVAGTLRQLYLLCRAHDAFRPTRFTCMGPFEQQLWLPIFNGITHLHFVADYFIHRPAWNPRALTHIVAQLTWNSLDDALPWLLNCPATLRRIAVWDSSRGEVPGLMEKILVEIARRRGERPGRIWMIGRGELEQLGLEHSASEEQHDHDSPIPKLTFSPALWSAGGQVGY